MSNYYEAKLGGVPYIQPYLDKLQDEVAPSLVDRVKKVFEPAIDAYVDKEKAKVKASIAKGVAIGGGILLFAFLVSRR